MSGPRTSPLRTALVFIGLSLPALGATQALASTEFRGGGYLSRFENCEAAGWTTGIETILVRFRPAGLEGNNPDNDSITFVYASGAANFFGPVSAADDGFANVTSTMIWSSAWQQNMTRIRVDYSSERNINEATTNGYLTITMENLEVEGCTAQANFAYARR
ncbi:MAG: hypothetical protein KDJ98_05685 [Rhodobacteraceae bacterium]|nr:hypothetical protein [Paracoccaceae bacterium]